MPKGAGIMGGGIYQDGGPLLAGGAMAPPIFLVAPAPESGHALVPALLEQQQRRPVNRLKPENALGGG